MFKLKARVCVWKHSALGGALSSLAFFCILTANSANAQIALDPTPGAGGTGLLTLCKAFVEGTIIATDGPCDGANAIFEAATTIVVGPSAKEITLDGSNAGGAVLKIGSGITQTTLDAASGNVSVGGKFFINGSNVTVDFNNNRLQSVGTPTAGTDAANKAYVDGENKKQDDQLTAIKNVNDDQNLKIAAIETVNTQQNSRLTQVETVNTQQDTRLTSLEGASAKQGQQIAAINQEISALSARDQELASGIAISIALDQPIFQPGQTFAVRAGYGDFDGYSAFGVTAAGVLARNFAGPGTSLVLDGGVGTSTSNDMFAGKAGITFGW